MPSLKLQTEAESLTKYFLSEQLCFTFSIDWKRCGFGPLAAETLALRAKYNNRVTEDSLSVNLQPGLLAEMFQLESGGRCFDLKGNRLGRCTP